MKGLILLLILSFATNIFLGHQYMTRGTVQHDQPSSNSGTVAEYPYLSPRIFINKQNDLLINFVQLRKELSDYQRTLRSRTGIYFEYLPSGTSIGVNEKDTYVPASLLKLPLAMGVYKKISDGKIKSDALLVLKTEDLDEHFGHLYQEGVGYQLTVEDAVHILLKDSDNTAQHTLYRSLSGDELDDIFDSLDIPKERNAEGQATVTPKNYSSILRCLYLSCFLNRDMSNDLLMYLTQTNFSDKLPAGVAQGVPVAHKIGVSTNADTKTDVYTDCGIIYEPRRPYILCVMTEGTDKQATTSISHISKLVYDYVSSYKK